MVLPTLDELRRFDRRHAHQGGLSRSGLIVLDPAEVPWGEETPRNSRVFAHTGGDSVHYCFLDVGGRTDERSPVVMVVPCNPDKPRQVVGESLAEFLSLGVVTGFFFLEQLVYDRRRALGFLFDWSAFIEDCYFGKTPPPDDLRQLEAQREVLHDLSIAFGLRPWSNPEQRLAELEVTWGSAIDLAMRDNVRSRPDEEL